MLPINYDSSLNFIDLTSGNYTMLQSLNFTNYFEMKSIFWAILCFLILKSSNRVFTLPKKLHWFNFENAQPAIKYIEQNDFAKTTGSNVLQTGEQALPTNGFNDK